jgi:hypothetical protein
MEGLMTNVVELRPGRNLGEVPHHADALSFMERRKPRGSGINHWNIAATGDYGQDCETGRELAREYLAYIGQYPTVGNATLLGCIVNDMVNGLGDRGRLSGIEIAFLGAINRAAMALAAYVPHAVTR